MYVIVAVITGVPGHLLRATGWARVSRQNVSHLLSVSLFFCKFTKQGPLSVGGEICVYVGRRLFRPIWVCYFFFLRLVLVYGAFPFVL